MLLQDPACPTDPERRSLVSKLTERLSTPGIEWLQNLLGSLGNLSGSFAGRAPIVNSIDAAVEEDARSEANGCVAVSMSQIYVILQPAFAMTLS